jgi:ABC-type transport system involved in Fe-S cluster assembly fused permease/ATPase subunit
VTDTSLVEVESVSFAYARRPILKGVSMRVPRGKVVAIMRARRRCFASSADSWRLRAATRF